MGNEGGIVFDYYMADENLMSREYRGKSRAYGAAHQLSNQFLVKKVLVSASVV